MKYFLTWVIGVVLLISSFSSNLWAEIYSYTDENGVRHFSNVPTSPEYSPYYRGSFDYFSGLFLSDRYDHYIYKASEIHDISFPLLKAIIKVESDFNPRAISHAGAMGLMQIMPGNLKALNIKNPFDPRENIMGGAKYLKKLLDRFDGKVVLALAAYNAGPSKVVRYNRVPPIPETENYVKRVLKYYRIIKKRY